MEIVHDAAGTALCEDFIDMLRVILGPPTDRPSPDRVLNWRNRDRIPLWPLLCGAVDERALTTRCAVFWLWDIENRNLKIRRIDITAYPRCITPLQRFVSGYKYAFDSV